MGTEINPETGLIPIILDLSQCNGCGLCFDACPEPYGLRPQGEEAAFELLDPSTVLGPRPFDAPQPEPRPDTSVPLPEREPLIVKGNLRGGGWRRPGRLPPRLSVTRSPHRPRALS